jgi:trigger factor
MVTGDEKRFGLTLAGDYPDAELRNQSIVFNVKLHEIKEKHLPELDDEFAKKVGGGDTLEALREAARARIQERLESEARRLYEDSLLEAAVERSTIEIPEVMIERQIDSEIDDLKGDLARQRISWADYLRVLSRSEEAVRADLREPAIRSLRGYLVLREIARREGIEVHPDEVTADIEATAEQFGRARNIVRERLSTRDQRDRIEARLLHDRTMERLKAIAQQPAPTPEATPAEPPSASAETPTETAPAQAPNNAAPEPERAAASPAPTDEETTHG